MKALGLRFSIGALFGLVGISLAMFAIAEPFNVSALQRFNDSTNRMHGPFPTIQLQQVASGFLSPVTVTNAGDGSGRLFIVQQTGEIRILIKGTILPTPFLDISELVGCGCGEQGLLGLAFHPDYANNGFFYVDYTDDDGNTQVARYTVSAGDPNVADPGSRHPILNQDQPFSNHNGGQLAFGPDGYLYIALGDGGSGGDPQENGQNLNTWLGKILRVDINGDDFPGDPNRNYAVPPDNPFVGSPNALDEIWAYGVRNPWRCTFDRSTGDFFIADVGQGQWEEINYQPAASAGGENYGWDVLEGMHCFEDQPPGSCNQFLNGGSTLPVLEYSHSLGCSVTGGYRYRGQLYPQLDGIYFYSDLCSGTIWGAIQNNGKWVSQDLLQSGLTVTTFGEDEAGEVYVANYSDGTLYQIVAEGPTPTPTSTVTATPTASATATVPPSPTPTPSVCIVIITNPTCGSVINSPPVDFSVGLSDPTDPSSIQPTDFMVNGTPADSFTNFNNVSIVFHFNTSPAVPGLNVMHIPSGAFNCTTGGTPEVTCTFTYQPSTPTPTPTATATATTTVTPTPSEAPCAAIGSEPACNSIVFTQLTDFAVYISGFVSSAPPPSVFTVNGIPADSASGGGSTIGFHFNASPVIPGQNTMNIPPGAFTCSNSGRSFEGFHCTFTYPRQTPAPRPHTTPRPRPTPPPRP